MPPVAPMARSSVTGTVYLFHYTVPVAGKQHYLGFTQNLAARLLDHASGQFGSQLTNLATKLGGAAILARTWEGVSVDFEKKLKRERHLGRHCPLCNKAEAASPVAPKAR